jgi:hypothetical protein
LGKNRTAPLQQAKLVTFNFQGVKALKKGKALKTTGYTQKLL